MIPRIEKLIFAAAILFPLPVLAQSSGDAAAIPNAVPPPFETETSSGAGAALRTLFSPVHEPRRKTMGLLQRSFVDLATRTDSPLQVAVVVDGTESMSMELESVRKSIHTMLDDLKRCRGDVQVAMVVYRDSRSPSGETQTLLKSFTNDRDAIAAAVEQLKSETGQPFFHELADVGLHTAMNDLDWSTAPAVTRWILWFGDAPPYQEGFKNPDYPESRRRFANDLLVTVANRKGIQVNGVLCNSSDNVSEPYEKSIDETRSFISEIVTGTDGLMIDLSYPEIRSALQQAGKRPTIDYTSIAPITADDIRRRANTLEETDGDAPTTPNKPVRVAVLPYQKLDQVSFDPKLDSVQIATAVRHRFDQISGVRVSSPVDVQRQLRRLQAEGIAPDEMLRSLTARLGVDYVVWGQIESPALVRTAAYQRSNGRPVFSVVCNHDPNNVAQVVVDAAAAGKQTGEQDDQATGDFQMLSQRVKQSNQKAPIEGPIAKSPAATSEILMAMESLQQALGQEIGSEASDELLKSAELSIASAVKTESQNALGHWLQANVAMNQASALYAAGESKSAATKMTLVRSSLRRAKRSSRNLPPSIAMEIDADEALLVRRNYSAAIDLYKQLAATEQPSSTRLRAHWMLTGLYAGDWGLANDQSELVDAVKVRSHAIEIMANWPESPAADMIRRWLRWDDDAQRSQFHHFPKSNVQLAQLGE
ncbi:MAG: vWA domain-containing protein [Pirellulaceae bacterium]